LWDGGSTNLKRQLFFDQKVGRNLVTGKERDHEQNGEKSKKNRKEEEDV